MPPVEVDRSPSPEESVNGLFRFDGGVWFFDPIRGAPHMMILFPSPFACPISTEQSESRVNIYVNVCGELWLPFYATCDEGFQEAVDWGKYRVERVSNETIEIWGYHPDVFRVKNAYPSHRLVRYYNEERRMADVVFIGDVPGADQTLRSGRLIK